MSRQLISEEESPSGTLPLLHSDQVDTTLDDNSWFATLEGQSPVNDLYASDKRPRNWNENAMSITSSLQLQVDMLRGKLSRRNQVLEVIRRAYHRDVIIIKEELRQYKRRIDHMDFTDSAQGNNKSELPTISFHPFVPSSVNGGLSSVPSVDLRHVLPLFAPGDTVLQVHPCDSCGGHLELIHGESKEVMVVRQEMIRATNEEQQMWTVLQRVRSEMKQMEEVNGTLQQQVQTLMQENTSNLEQLQATRKTEREQKVIIASMRSKLQLGQATQDEVDRLSIEFHNVKQQFIRTDHECDVLSATNKRLKEELAEVTKALHLIKVEKAQLESDCGTNYFRLQEELRQGISDLAVRDEQLKAKMTLCSEQQQGLTSLNEELVSTVQRFEKTKRYLEDQLSQEEGTKKSMQEENLELRRLNKKLEEELDTFRKDSFNMVDPTSNLEDVSSKSQSVNQPVALSNNRQKELEEKFQYQLEWTSMRENDLAGILARGMGGVEKLPLPQQVLHRIPSDTAIHRAATIERRVANAIPAKIITLQLHQDKSRRADKTDSVQSEPKQSVPVNTKVDESENVLERNEPNVEAYLMEHARILAKVKEGKVKIAKQNKTIQELERKNFVLTVHLEASKESVETLTGSVNTLKEQLSQQDVSAAKMTENLVQQIEDAKRDQASESEKNTILMTFFRTVSEFAHKTSENQELILESELDSAFHNGHAEVDQTGEQIRSKALDVHRQVLKEKAMEMFSSMCRDRAEWIGAEMHKLRADFELLRANLVKATDKSDSDELHIRTLESEMSKLQLKVNGGRNDLKIMERSLKHTTEKLDKYIMKYKTEQEKLAALKEELGKVQEDEKRLALLLSDKTKAWQEEIDANNKCKEKIKSLEAGINDVQKERQLLQAQLHEKEELAEFRRQTNQSVEVSVMPDTTESVIQTDRWKPQGLILRQRNGHDRMPQRYLGNASVMIHFPELNRAPTPESITSLCLNQQVSDSGRQTNSSCRLKGLSRLYLSSDGISQKYRLQQHDKIASWNGNHSTTDHQEFDERAAEKLTHMN